MRLCSLDNLMDALKECNALNIPWNVKTPCIAYDETGKGEIAFEIIIGEWKGYPDRIVYEEMTPEHLEDTKLLFPDFHR